MRRGVVGVLLAAVLLGALAQPRTEPVSVLGTTFVRDEPSTLGFPIGWYTGLWVPNDLPHIVSNGMRSVMPYHSSTDPEEIRPYLDTSQASGIKVLLELPRRFVRDVDTAAVEAFVTALKGHPALLGWYLADEPTYNDELGPLSAADAETLYTTIKRTDPSHPVAIAFPSTDLAAANYRPAMDVMMVDDYPSVGGSPEFNGFVTWTYSMARAAEVARAERDFFPVIQGFGTNDGAWRLPTVAEERFMVFASLQMGATGLFFWTHDRTDNAWADEVLSPIVARVKQMRRALIAGERPSFVRALHSDVHATAFRDRRTKAVYIVAVHYRDGTVSAPLWLRRTLRDKKAVLLDGEPRRVRIRKGHIAQSLGPYEVKLYRLR